MKNFLAYTIGCLVGVLICVGLAALEGLIVSLLWNWLAPLFWTNAPVLSIWQAFGILVLINILFSVFKRKG